MYNNPYNYYPYMNIPRNPFPSFNTFNPNYTFGNGFIGNGMQQVRPSSSILKGGLFKGISNIKWGDVLNNTQKTLNVINQAIPVYYQIKPIFNNVKSFSHLVSAFNSNDTNEDNINQNANNVNNINKDTKKENSSNSPTFFIS